MKALQQTDPVSERLHMDLNYARSGRGCMELTALFVLYYNTLRAGSETNALFARIHSLA